VAARPNLEHLRTQAKQVLSQLRSDDDAAAQTFVDFLPAAKDMTPDHVRRAKFRLADAQSAIARKSGFAAWQALARHVEHLRALEGEWRFDALEVDGAEVPASMMSGSRLLIDGDRSRMESAEGIYEGIFTIDVEATPAHIDVEFVAGPEVGNWSHGVFDSMATSSSCASASWDQGGPRRSRRRADPDMRSSGCGAPRPRVRPT
jgi:uncharacterized protein (TIGR03067 family)